MHANPAFPHGTPLREAIADAILRAGEADPTAELRALVAALETPAGRLFARYTGRPPRALRPGPWTVLLARLDTPRRPANRRLPASGGTARPAAAAPASPRCRPGARAPRRYSAASR